jgi:hypothetical protein
MYNAIYCQYDVVSHARKLVVLDGHLTICQHQFYFKHPKHNKKDLFL